MSRSRRYNGFAAWALRPDFETSPTPKISLSKPSMDSPATTQKNLLLPRGSYPRVDQSSAILVRHFPAAVLTWVAAQHKLPVGELSARPKVRRGGSGRRVGTALSWGRKDFSHCGSSRRRPITASVFVVFRKVLRPCPNEASQCEPGGKRHTPTHSVVAPSPRSLAPPRSAGCGAPLPLRKPRQSQRFVPRWRVGVRLLARVLASNPAAGLRKSQQVAPTWQLGRLPKGCQKPCFCLHIQVTPRFSLTDLSR